MPRRPLSPNDRENFAKPVLWDAQAAVFTTLGPIPLGASLLFLGVPPFLVTTPIDGNYFPVRVSAGDTPRPTHVELYRDDPFWWRIDAIADTRQGAYRPGGIPVAYPLNPAAATLSFTSVNNTSPMRVNWLWGAG
jgi:hypothetical protein